ncbi:hypothetical protein RSAG8_04080, partial [Rhizoctonia solani AG-8 WAC10335]
MSLVKLPSEILYAIGQITMNDPYSILSLCLVNKWTYQSLSTLLYRSVRLDSDRSVSSFCDVVTSLRPDYSRYVVVLQIGPDWCVDDDGDYRLQRGLVPQLRRVLRSLVHLKHLSLSTTRKAFGLLFGGLNVPFQLDTFVHSGRLTKPLLRFLEGQPSIVRLGCHASMGLGSEKLLSDSVKANPNLLPKLRELESAIYIVADLLGTRPISSLAVLGPMDLIYDRLTGLEFMIDSLKYTMVPLTRICIAEEVGIGNHWALFVGALRKSHASSTLKEISILHKFPLELQDYQLTVEKVMEGSYSFSFLRFEALEKFEIVQASGSRYDPPPSDILAWLTLQNMEHLSSWRKHNPMLQTVILHGYMVT